MRKSTALLVLVREAWRSQCCDDRTKHHRLHEAIRQHSTFAASEIQITPFINRFSEMHHNHCRRQKHVSMKNSELTSENPCATQCKHVTNLIGNRSSFDHCAAAVIRRSWLRDVQHRWVVSLKVLKCGDGQSQLIHPGCPKSAHSTNCHSMVGAVSKA